MSSVTQSTDPRSQFDAAVRAHMPKHRTASYQERQNAISMVARTNPKLHQAYLEATNSSIRGQRQIREKYNA